MTQDILIQTLGQLSHGQDWRLSLAHDRPDHLFLWITRGQGVVLLDGLRRGLGTHNALFIPANSVFSVELGRQSTGLAVTIPAGTPLRLPEMPRHLRIRDVHIQSELTGIIEAAQREALGAHPLKQDALEAHAALLSVWLRRQIVKEEHVPEKRNAAGRLSQHFSTLLARDYKIGHPMASYAAQLNVTPTHLTRAIKAATGKSAAELLTERVLHAARLLLIDTSEPARQIAQHLGFGSAAYFSRFIQQHTGHSPSALRGRKRPLE